MKYVLNAELMLTRDMAHEHMAAVFGFPDHYGHNLDALYDCLSEMNDVEVEVQNLKEENAYMKKVLRVMQDAGVRVC